jgi:hypothetical protein
MKEKLANQMQNEKQELQRILFQRPDSWVRTSCGCTSGHSVHDRMHGTGLIVYSVNSPIDSLGDHFRPSHPLITPAWVPPVRAPLPLPCRPWVPVAPALGPDPAGQLSWSAGPLLDLYEDLIGGCLFLLKELSNYTYLLDASSWRAPSDNLARELSPSLIPYPSHRSFIMIVW